jgi:hypothetical protein
MLGWLGCMHATGFQDSTTVAKRPLTGLDHALLAP